MAFPTWAGEMGASGLACAMSTAWKDIRCLLGDSEYIYIHILRRQRAARWRNVEKFWILLRSRDLPSDNVTRGRALSRGARLTQPGQDNEGHDVTRLDGEFDPSTAWHRKRLVPGGEAWAGLECLTWPERRGDGMKRPGTSAENEA